MLIRGIETFELYLQRMIRVRTGKTGLFQTGERIFIKT